MEAFNNILPFLWISLYTLCVLACISEKESARYKILGFWESLTWSYKPVPSISRIPKFFLIPPQRFSDLAADFDSPIQISRQFRPSWFISRVPRIVVYRRCELGFRWRWRSKIHWKMRMPPLLRSRSKLLIRWLSLCLFWWYLSKLE